MEVIVVVRMSDTHYTKVLRNFSKGFEQYVASLTPFKIQAGSQMTHGTAIKSKFKKS